MTDEERVADLDRIADRAASEAESLRWLLTDWRRLKAELDNSEPIGQHCACRYDGERLLQECVPHAAMRRDAARWRKLVAMDGAYYFDCAAGMTQAVDAAIVREQAEVTTD